VVAEVVVAATAVLAVVVVVTLVATIAMAVVVVVAEAEVAEATVAALEASLLPRISMPLLFLSAYLFFSLPSLRQVSVLLQRLLCVQARQRVLICFMASSRCPQGRN
jgi:hypothetical protein